MPLQLHDLQPNPGSNRDKKRVGRGHGSGSVKTAGRGTKGQKARSGKGVRPGFEGGQLPIQQRLPYKRGFTNIYKTRWEVVNLDRLTELPADEPITPEILLAHRLIRGLEFPVKILGDGAVAGALEIHAHAFSASARERIEGAGGMVVELERTDRWTEARPRSRALPLNRELKQMRVGKVGGPSRKEALEILARREGGNGNA
jgi:large subunit ribosomal protein L15